MADDDMSSISGSEVDEETETDLTDVELAREEERLKVGGAVLKGNNYDLTNFEIRAYFSDCSAWGNCRFCFLC